MTTNAVQYVQGNHRKLPIHSSRLEYWPSEINIIILGTVLQSLHIMFNLCQNTKNIRPPSTQITYFLAWTMCHFQFKSNIIFLWLQWMNKQYNGDFGRKWKHDRLRHQEDIVCYYLSSKNNGRMITINVTLITVYPTTAINICYTYECRLSSKHKLKVLCWV